ncbi:MAG: hypothetical protein P4M05_28490 [Bradyrhizobium sp.]|nr:hypothetical protein [Bradyrhizobium sp.]
MTNIALLPYISGSFTVATNSDWDDSIQFNQPSPNETLPLDISDIDFFAQLRASPVSPNILMALSTINGLLINGGKAGTLTWNVPAYPRTTAPFDNMRSLQSAISPLVMDVVAVADGRVRNLFEKAGPASVSINPGVTLK